MPSPCLNTSHLDVEEVEVAAVMSEDLEELVVDSITDKSIMAREQVIMTVT